MKSKNTRHSRPISRAKKALAAAVAGFLLASPANAKVSIDTSPVVQLVCDDRRGTAVKIDDDTYITVAHVAEAEGCKIDGTPVTVVESDPKDFAILKGPRSKIKARYSCRGFVPNREYIAVGYGFGWPVLMRQPLRASGFKVVGEPHQMFTGEVIPGMSGGPVYNTAGRVVGVVNMRWPARSLPLSETSLCKRN